MTHSFRTAEYVSPKHPDKLCDRVADAILDAHLKDDPTARVAVEVMGGHGQIFVTGEVTSSAEVAIEPIVERIAGGGLKITENIAKQSPEIAGGVDSGGAGDQGIMIGYACDETPELLPLEYSLARNLNQFLYKKWSRDGKTQITLRNGLIHSVVASWQGVPSDELETAVLAWLRNASGYVGPKRTNLYINPAGDWQIGGFEADTGLTGRKLIVDNYGPRVAIGGGAFSGKDPSKVDRSSAYMARKIAVDYLRRFQAKEVLVRLAYAIGHDQPVEATVIIDGSEQKIEGYDLSPNGIIDQLQLRRPIYEDLATNGHFGRPGDLSWEIDI